MAVVVDDSLAGLCFEADVPSRTGRSPTRTGSAASISAAFKTGMNSRNARNLAHRLVIVQTDVHAPLVRLCQPSQNEHVFARRNDKNKRASLSVLSSEMQCA